jgi:hypothetical protein
MIDHATQESQTIIEASSADQAPAHPSGSRPGRGYKE